MNPETDRIQVPTNGRRPHPPTPSADDAATVDAVLAGDPDDAAEAGDGDDATEPTISVTPTQLAVGFGIVASLILLFVGRRHRRG